MRRKVVAIVLAASLTACGLSLMGTDTQNDQLPTTTIEGGGGGAPADAGGIIFLEGGSPFDTGPVAPPLDAAGACTTGSCLAVPAGWDLIAYGDGTVACPTGFSSTDVFENPTATPNACTCSASSCKIVTLPSCSSGSIGSYYDNSGGGPACDRNGAGLLLNNGGCVNGGGSFGDHAEVPAPLPNGSGTCSAPAVPDKTGVTSTPGRVCISSCNDVCSPTLPASFKACLVATGDQACPAQAPTKHLTGTDFSLTCGNCACAVGNAGCTGTMNFYANRDCTQHSATLDSGACVDTGGASFSSYKWTGIVKGVTCNPSKPPTGVVAPTGVSTVCCP